MRIAVGCDHGGLGLCRFLERQMKQWGIDTRNLGCYVGVSVAYPTYAQKVSNWIAVADKTTTKNNFGLLVCRTGIGMSIAANKHPAVRAALCHTIEQARLARQHNDANVLCLGADMISEHDALIILETFVATEFSGEDRHLRRIRLLTYPYDG